MIKLKKNRIYGIDGDDYHLDNTVEGGFLMRSVDCPGVTQHFSHEDLVETWQRGMLSVRAMPLPELGGAAVPPIDGSMSEEAARRRVCQAFMVLRETGEASLSDCSMAAAIATILQGDPLLSRHFERARRVEGLKAARIRVTPSNLRRWLLRYEDGRPTRSLPAPVSRSGGERDATWEALVSRAAEIGRSPDHINPELVRAARRHGIERALRVWSMCAPSDAGHEEAGIGGNGRAGMGRLGGRAADGVT